MYIEQSKPTGNTMKLAISLICLMASTAYATTPTPTSTQNNTASQYQHQDQIAHGGAGGSGGDGGSANGVSLSNAYLQGGNTAGGSASASGGKGGSGYSASSNDIDLSSRIKSLSLIAPPVWTVIPQANGCIVSDSTAWSGVFGFASYSGSKQLSDAVCTMVNMASGATAMCQHKTAGIINRRVFEAINPGVSGEFLEISAHPNLTPTECAELIRPRLILDGRGINR